MEFQLLIPKTMRTVIGMIGMMVLFSCEKTVTVKLPDVDSKLVVEGYVETGKAPYVILSRSLDYFGSVNLNEVLQQTVQGLP